MILIGSLASCAQYNAQSGLLGPLLLDMLTPVNTENSLVSWTKRRKITINNSAQAEALINFPILLILKSTNIDYSQTQNSGQDLRFYDADGSTPLAYEIEKWDETGSSYVWVKVPQIDASSSTDFIYMYYGNATAADGQSATTVWDSSYSAIMHHNASFNDSTANANHGTPSGGPTDVTSAKIAGGKQFAAASSQYYTFPTSSWSVSSGTVEAWVYPYTSAGSNRYVISHRNGSTDSRIYLLTKNGTEFWTGIGDCYASSDCGKSPSSLTLNTW